MRDTRWFTEKKTAEQALKDHAKFFSSEPNKDGVSGCRNCMGKGPEGGTFQGWVKIRVAHCGDVGRAWGFTGQVALGHPGPAELGRYKKEMGSYGEC